MAQAPLKKGKPAAKRPTNLGPKRGTNGSIAPKKTSLIRQQKITKKLTAGLAAKTEMNLAQRAGHLEMLAGGKKDKKKKEQEKAKGKGQGKK